MQTTLLTIQNGNSAPAPQPKVTSVPDNQFQRALSRQIEQRQVEQRQAQNPEPSATVTPAKTAAPAPTPAAPKTASPSKPAAADKPSADDKPAASAVTDETTQAPASGQVAPLQADATLATNPSDESDTQAALAGPVADMLALVASFNQAVTQPASARVAESTPQDAILKAVAPTKLQLEPAKLPLDLAKPQPDLLKPQPDLVNPQLDLVKPQPDLVKPQLDPAKLEPTVIKMRDATLEPALAIKEPLPGVAGIAAPVQQASLEIVQAASAVPADKLNGRVGSPAWDQQLGQKIVWMVAGGSQSASLTLNPPDLGPLQVVLNVSNDQASVTFTSAQPEVRQALDAAMPRLREMMNDAGIQLGNATVSAGTSQQQARQESGTGRRSGTGGADGGQIDDGAVRGMASIQHGVALGLVDTFA